MQYGKLLIKKIGITCLKVGCMRQVQGAPVRIKVCHLHRQQPTDILAVQE